MVKKRRGAGRGSGGGRIITLATAPAPRALSAARKFWIRIIVAAIPLIVLLALEVGLRVAGFGHHAGFSMKATVDGRAVLRDNPTMSWRFFPRRLARAQIPFQIPAAKSPGTYRIFVLGESAAQGIPDHTFGFARILEVLLQDRYPGVSFEVVNTAITAINSHVVREIAQDCARHSPDLFLVYMGNNEVVGPYGPGTVFAPAASTLPLLRAGLWLTTFRSGQLASALLSRGAKDAPQAWQGMEMFLGNQVAERDGRMPAVYDHFRQNLEDICRIAGKSGARIVVGTIATNLRDSAPFASLHRPDLREPETEKWNRLYGDGNASESAGKLAEAAQRYQQAAQIDDQFADLHYRLGRLSEQMDDFGKARQSYLKARDLDTLRFRADSRMNDIIRTSANAGAVLLDVEERFMRLSPNGLPGEALFHEHVHMTFSGNYALATGMAERIAGVVPQWVKQRQRAGWQAPSESDCARRLAYTDWNRQQIASQVLHGFLKRPPFVNQSNHAEQVLREEARLAGLRAMATSTNALEQADAVYREALARSGSDPWLRYNYAVFRLMARGDAPGAKRHLEQFVQTLPGYAPAHGHLGVAAMRLGLYADAMAQFSEELRINPSSATAHANLGLVLAEGGRWEEAVAEYNRALEIDPNHPAAHNDLGAAYAQRGRDAEAIREYRAAIGLEPDYAGAHYNLAAALHSQGQRVEAVKHYREALRVRWNWPQVHNDLAILFHQQGNTADALTHWAEALRQKPDFAEAHNNVGKVLAERGQLQLSMRRFEEALRIAPGYREAANNLELVRLKLLPTCASRPDGNCR